MCALDRADAEHRVRYVYDGDTVRLVDGRRVRIIGLDTPELGRKGRPPQALAQEARDFLRQLLPKSDVVKLRRDSEDRDDYGRTLSHLFLPDGTNVTESLLEQGLATALVVPPNLWHLECYREAEDRARKSRRGIWNLPQYQPRRFRDLPPTTRGFRIVDGRIKRISPARKAIWLELEGGPALRISKKDLRYFAELMPAGLDQKSVRARGWVYSSKGQLRMNIRHPAALAILDP